MPTKRLQLQLFAALVGVLVALLVGCPANDYAAKAKAQPVVLDAGQTTTPDAAPGTAGTQADSTAEEEAEEHAEQAVEEPAVEEPADQGESTDGSTGEPETKVPRQTVRSKNYLAPAEEGVKRPEAKPSRKRSFKTVELWFLKAEYNAAEDAEMSHLTFEFRANLGRKQKQVEQVTISNFDDAVGARLDLGLCLVEIYPIVQPPKFEGYGGAGRVGLRYDGMYQIKVFLPDGELIAIFGIYADGSFSSAPLDLRPEGYLVSAVRRTGSYGPVPHTVYRKTVVGQKLENLVTIQFNGGGFEQRQVEDAVGSLFNYRFPTGRLELFDPNE